jgi:hypothetical protein
MSVRDAAARYIARGFRVIPMVGVDPAGGCLCGGRDCNAGKHELAHLDGLWKDGHEFRVTDFAADMNIALALGPWRPGKWLVCLDLDGVTSPAGALEIAPWLTPTLTQKSPRGVHLFYWVPDFTPLGNWVDAFKTKYTSGYAVDVRYARGKINVAPSRTAFGTYTWADPNAEVAQLPWPIIDRILGERRRRKLPVLSRWQRDGKRA